jgi:hypothetical protein
MGQFVEISRCPKTTLPLPIPGSIALGNPCPSHLAVWRALMRRLRRGVFGTAPDRVAIGTRSVRRYIHDVNEPRLLSGDQPCLQFLHALRKSPTDHPRSLRPALWRPVSIHREAFKPPVRALARTRRSERGDQKCHYERSKHLRSGLVALNPPVTHKFLGRGFLLKTRIMLGIGGADPRHKR